jgi:hypothetical protein
MSNEKILIKNALKSLSISEKVFDEKRENYDEWRYIQIILKDCFFKVCGEYVPCLEIVTKAIATIGRLEEKMLQKSVEKELKKI